MFVPTTFLAFSNLKNTFLYLFFFQSFFCMKYEMGFIVLKSLFKLKQQKNEKKNELKAC